MKKLMLLLSFAILCSQTTFAQLRKGNFQLGGAVNFTSNKTHNFQGDQNYDHYSSQDFSANPNFGLFITDNWVVGLSFNFYKGGTEVRYNNPILRTNDYKNRIWGTGLFARRYFPLHEQIAFFGEFKSTVDWRTDENSIEGQQTNSLTYRVFNNTLFAGLSFFPTKWISMEASVSPVRFGLSRRTDKPIPGVNEKRNSTFFNAGINTSAIFLGFNFFLNRK